MLINPNNKLSLKKGEEYFNKLCEGKTPFNIKEEHETRGALLNRALHKFFDLIAKELNDLGHEFTYNGLNIDTISTRYNTLIVKDFFWRPIQRTLFDIESTTKLNSKHINEITDIIIKFFGERGVVIEFPNKESFLKQLNKYDKH